jgi:hypothetical protein
VLSEQPHEEGKVLTVNQEQGKPARQREPSIQEVAERIARSLGSNGDEARLRQIVWDLGRTQAQALCAEVFEHPGSQALAEQFFHLVETKGVKKQRTSPTPPPNDQAPVKETARLIAEKLGEQQENPRQTILRSVRVLGIETALALLQKTHETEAAGGLLIPDGSRRRTPGGVYFFFVRQEVPAAQLRQIFVFYGLRAPKVPGTPQVQHAPKQQQSQPQAPAAVLTWAERGQVLDETEQEQGEARTVKMTVIGRPGKIVERAQCVAFSMQQQQKIPSLPAGLPLPSIEQAGATRYSVYVAARQWKNVAEAIAADAEDLLIVEGFPILDGERGTIAVFASNVTTRKLQAASKQANVS